ncbi:hypothetical protein HUU59_11215 [bacterium]|nr:hypothetical protein [bacterium]
MAVLKTFGHSRTYYIVLIRQALAVSMACLFSLFLSVQSAPAQTQGLYVNGFASQGFVTTSANQLLVDRSEKGSFEYNEVGTTVLATPTDKLRVGIQFLARDLGLEGNNQVFIDWAGGDYQWQDYLGARVGKIKLPLGFHNQGRDIDMLRTSVLLPQCVYNEGLRDFVLAHEGMSLYGNVPLHNTGYFDYEVWCGTLNIPNPRSGFWGGSFELGGFNSAPAVAQEVLMEYGADSSTIAVEYLGSQNEKVLFPVVYGGAFTWSPPIPGLRLGTTAIVGEFELSSRWQYAVSLVDSNGNPREFTRQVNYEDEFDINQLLTFSAEYAWRCVTLSGEFNSNLMNEGHSGSSREEGLYGMVNCRTNKWLTCGMYYGVYYARADDREGEFAKLRGWPDYVAWEKDLALSTRFELNTNWMVKAEYHYIDGVALREGMAIHEGVVSGDLERYWHALLLKTTVHF